MVSPFQMKVETTMIVCPLCSLIAKDELVRSLVDQGVLDRVCFFPDLILFTAVLFGADT